MNDFEDPDAPPPPPNWEKEELASMESYFSKDDPAQRFEEEVSEIMLWDGMEEAFDAFYQAGLFPEHRNKILLSYEIRDRLKAYDPMLNGAYWHEAQKDPVKEQHPWMDLFMLLAFGTEAGFILHNTFDQGLSQEALDDLGWACAQVSGSKPEAMSVTWQPVNEASHRLGLGENSIDFSPDKALWTVPMHIINFFNKSIGANERRFEIITLLPIYGETLVFYLNAEEKGILESQRGWQFFDWGQLDD